YSSGDASARVDLLTDLASAEVYVDERAGVETALRAVDAARTDGSAAQFGRAVAVFVEPVYGVSAFPAEVTGVFDEVRVVLGDNDAFTSTITELAHIGAERRWLPARVYAAQWRVTQALLEGRFDDVRAYEQELRGYARAYRGAAGMYRIQMFYLLREEGRLPDLGGSNRRIEPEVDVLYAWALLSLSLLESGSAQAALDNLDTVAAKNLHSGE